MENYSIADRSAAPETAGCTELAEHPELLQELLANRGITKRDEAEKFLSPDYDRDTHDPFLMKDMSRAAERIIKAINENEKIIIYSDYDADGIPGAVALHDLFKKIGFENFENYIPHRHEEGFGLNVEAIEQFGAEEVGEEKNGNKNSAGKAKVLITIDCGITDLIPVARAKELGIDVIVTDHHEPGAALPDAYAILNPKQPGCEYPEKMLCGAGVIFKLIQAILLKKELIKNPVTSLAGATTGSVSAVSSFPAINKGWEKWLLDMVGLATLSDMVPLRGENRTFAYYGLKVLRISPRVGLMKLIRKAGGNQRHVTEDDINFTISPRINAASRMGIPMDAFRLLSTKDEVLAGTLTDHLDLKNNERKGIVASMIRDINKRLEERVKNDTLHEVIVLGNPDWKPSLLGLVANSLKEDHGRPVFLWGRESSSVIKGSCRSDGSVSVVMLMESIRETFIQFGGHEFSGGFSLEQEKIHSLEDNLINSYKQIVEAGSFTQTKQTIDRRLSIDDVTWDTWRVIEKLAPFGVGNPKPVFLFENTEVAEVKQFGKEKNHLELKLKKTGEESGKTVSAIKFFSKPENFSPSGKISGSLKAGEKINLIATLEKSMFRNFPELRLRIIDIV